MSCPRSVLVTGANRGIGLELVRQLAIRPSAPKHIVASCRDPDNAQDLQSLTKEHPCVTILKLDVIDFDSFEGVVQSVHKVVDDQGLNVLINNAGMLDLARRTLDTVTAETMRKTYELNTIGPLMLSKAFLPLLRRASEKNGDQPISWCRAAIVNIGSKVGSVSENKMGSLYAYRASKSALNIVTKSLSIDLKPDSILAVVLHPGYVRTGMGNYKGLINPDESAKGMLNEMSKLSDQDLEGCMDYKGDLIAW